MEHRAAPPDDVIVQVNAAAAVAAVDERISTGQITEEDVGIVDDGRQIGGGGGDRTRRTFSQSYKMRHRNPLVRTRYIRSMHADRSPTKTVS
jgi:KUP system potassium uptake protein